MKPPTPEQIVKWIVQNVQASDVPADEGNEDALIYNLMMLARHGRPYGHYDYKPEQDAEIDTLLYQYITSEASADETPNS